MVDAAALLRSYGANALLAEHLCWEAMRTHLTAAAYAPPTEPTKTLFLLDGIPGAGKSTALKWLQPVLGAEYFSMARFAEARGVSADERRLPQLLSGTPHPVDVAFIEAIAASSAGVVLLEKFPRTAVEAALMLNEVAQHGWRFEILHLELPGDSVALSTQRQMARGPRHGRMPEPDHARVRALTHLARATSARETLRSCGVPIHNFDMTRPFGEIRNLIRRAVGIGFDELSWHRSSLEALEQVAGGLGIEAFAACGSFYRPFWNGRFGPPQRPTDIDVAVDSPSEVEPLLEALEREFPQERWSVLCPSVRLVERHGIETQSAIEAKAFCTFLHRTGLVRLHKGTLDVLIQPHAEWLLRQGQIALNPALLQRLDKAGLAELIRRDGHRVERVLSDYPGLAVAPDTAAILGMRTRPATPVRGDFACLKAKVLQSQHGRRRAGSPLSRRALTPEEWPVAAEILRFHQEAVQKPEAPPSPPPPRSNDATRAVTPKGLLVHAHEADDAAFGAWFHEQTHSHRPGGTDPDVRAILTFSAFAEVSHRRRRNLGPLHQGWHLERHLAESVLQLRTDALVGWFSDRREVNFARNLRLCMRLAMLFHDTGKLVGERPRRHGDISAKLFLRFRPKGFPDSLLPLTTWMIRTHDLFGSFARGLTDKQCHPAADYAVNVAEPSSYYGALDAEAARAQLLASALPLDEAAAIQRELWRADIGAIASLRWLLPVASLVERLLLISTSGPGRRIERRKPLFPFRGGP